MDYCTDLRVASSKPLGGDRFLFQVNFDDVLLVLTKISESTVWSSFQALHESFRVASPDFVPWYFKRTFEQN